MADTAAGIIMAAALAASTNNNNNNTFTAATAVNCPPPTTTLQDSVVTALAAQNPAQLSLRDTMAALHSSTTTCSKPPARRTPSEQRNIRLEQNRRAARESRLRKKRMVGELQATLVTLAQRNQVLQQEYKALQKQLTQAQIVVAQQEQEEQQTTTTTLPNIPSTIDFGAALQTALSQMMQTAAQNSINPQQAFTDALTATMALATTTTTTQNGGK